ncbi:hypothetical protein [Propionibacterium acidifaciens]|nr:hypothetical protein [Propionibacterium acidifaciens]
MFWRITMPLLRPILALVLIMTMIWLEMPRVLSRIHSQSMATTTFETR